MLGRIGQHDNREDDRDHENQIAAEIGQDGRRSDADVIEQGLRTQDQRNGNS